MWQRLVVEHGLVVGKETVRHAMRILDPEGVDQRLRHGLKRRQYKGGGHIDCYDKLKPFGFCIHGAIDGYSRRMLGLEVGMSKNDPGIVQKYFMDCVKQVGGAPRTVRADNGTEKTYVAGFQRFLRNNSCDSFAKEKSFKYGRSASNQGIESWWSQLRKVCTGWWMTHFKELRDNGFYCDANPIHVNCLRFCYMGVIREELQRVARLWNNHSIRPFSNSESPSGRPNLLFSLPEITDTHKVIVTVPEDDITVCEEFLGGRNISTLDCSGEFLHVANIIMQEENLVMAETPFEARYLYFALLNHIDRL
ncbi:uncharacterized protein LOC111341967 [Stylophora pistillata]|uniref:uncharacterized protein LOC111341967 n=1 Tax=Stylophora pistillata TaxID=50429 RepID=UPI000C04CAE7|nr:uncharacterized protein LOC111341967 [Stylophora pistillata]